MGFLIHQIYGLYADGKEMNELFKTSNKEWSEYAKRNDCIYKLWNKEEVEELVNTFANIKEYYYDVKYPVMKVDIARFLIIYHFGGMYVDLDVIPIKDKIEIDETKLTLCKYMNKKDNMDIEIIYSPKYNLDLFNFVAFYIPSQISEKNETLPNSWKIRYVFHTTGPQSFRRYLKKNKLEFNIIPTAHLEKEDTFGIGIDMIKYGDYDYDCLSYFSMSYNPHGNKNVEYKKKNKNVM